MASRRFRKEDYPLVVRFVDRHIVVTSPDFKFPIPVVRAVDPDHPNLGLIGQAIILAYLQIEEALKDRPEHPSPTPARDAVPSLPKTISLTEACRKVGMKPDAVRTLGDDGIIECRRTAGGHRRFNRESVEKYAATKNVHSETSLEHSPTEQLNSISRHDHGVLKL